MPTALCVVAGVPQFPKWLRDTQWVWARCLHKPSLASENFVSCIIILRSSIRLVQQVRWQAGTEDTGGVPTLVSPFLSSDAMPACGDVGGGVVDTSADKPDGTKERKRGTSVV